MHESHDIITLNPQTLAVAVLLFGIFSFFRLACSVNILAMYMYALSFCLMLSLSVVLHALHLIASLVFIDTSMHIYFPFLNF